MAKVPSNAIELATPKKQPVDSIAQKEIGKTLQASQPRIMDKEQGIEKAANSMFKRDSKV